MGYKRIESKNFDESTPKISIHVEGLKSGSSDNPDYFEINMEFDGDNKKIQLDKKGFTELRDQINIELDYHNKKSKHTDTNKNKKKTIGFIK